MSSMSPIMGSTRLRTISSPMRARSRQPVPANDISPMPFHPKSTPTRTLRGSARGAPGDHPVGTGLLDVAVGEVGYDIRRDVVAGVVDLVAELRLGHVGVDGTARAVELRHRDLVGAREDGVWHAEVLDPID